MAYIKQASEESSEWAPSLKQFNMNTLSFLENNKYDWRNLQVTMQIHQIEHE